MFLNERDDFVCRFTFFFTGNETLELGTQKIGSWEAQVGRTLFAL